MMVNNKGQKSNRIPVRFLDEEQNSTREAGSSDAQDAPRDEVEGDVGSSEEMGRASIYEDETEMQRRIDRGQEEGSGQGRERAEDADTAGGPHPAETPEQREDQDEAHTDRTKSRMQSAPDDEAGASPQAGDAAAGPALAELIATRAELRRVQAERADLVDKLARRQADFENYRKRLERERGESYNRMVADVVSKLLPVLDNLRRALDAEASLEGSESEEFRHFLRGVELIYKQLNDVLEGLGVEPVAAVGQPFDPHIHEAVVTEQTEEYEPDTVMQEIVRGYRLGEKLLRPAMVKVATR